MPVGLQLVWGLRAAIGRGTLQPGERLPALRELARDLGVNLNTMRAVVARLAQEGLLVARHGSGTFVAADPPRQPGLDAVLSTARKAAATAGISPRELAVALWAADGGESAADEEATARRRVREEIGALERLLAHHAIRAASPGPNDTRAPRVLTLEELEVQRDHLLDRLTASPEPPDAPIPGATSAATPARPRRPIRPAVS